MLWGGIFHLVAQEKDFLLQHINTASVLMQAFMFLNISRLALKGHSKGVCLMPYCAIFLILIQ